MAAATTKRPPARAAKPRPPGALLNRTDAAAYVGVSTRAWDRNWAAGNPARLPLSVVSGLMDSAVWRRADLDAWVESLKTVKPEGE